MTGITHKQAGRYMRKALDGLLTADQRRDLQTHLDECAACRLESESFSLLTARLKTDFQARWDTQHGPSKNVMANVQSQTRRIIMKKRIDFAFNILGGAAALLVLFFVITSVISQFQKKSAASNGTQVPVSSPQGNDRLIAFTSRQGNNYEIYTVHADGSDEKNITNNPAYDANPFWSPDGKRIAFQSDRSNDGYYSQIFIMDTDGSNVTLLTTDKGEHQLPLNSDGNTNPWSPDGSKLLYLRKGLSETEWILQYIDINTGEITSLFNGRFSFNDITWSPDGNHIGFVFNASPDFDKFVPQFHIVSADGTNLVNISNLLPANETFAIYSNVNNHAWSRDGQFFFFVASDVTVENQNSENQIWKVYKVGMDGTLSLQTSTRTPIGGFWEGTYFITPFGSSGWTWVHPDGSTNTINPMKECEQERLYHPEDSSYTSAFANFSQSPNGNGIIIATCPDGNIHLSWVNSLGTQVSPIAKLSTAPDVIYADWTLWSQDDKFFAFHTGQPSTNNVEAYIVNVVDALKNPSLPLAKISLGKSESGFIFPPAWQPILVNDVVEEKPTPEPEQTPSPNDLVAFMAETNLATNNNTDIYTMRMDGSGVTNLTHDPTKDFNANDYNPAWSPDKKKIAFISDRGGNSTGNIDIFVMNPDGSDQTRLTNNPGLDDFLAWSPDGKQIAYYSSPVDEFYATGQLIIMNSDGSNKTVITQEPGYYYFQGWSPDEQKIVYGKPRLVGESFKDIGIYMVDIDGKNQHEWFVGNFDQLHWEDSEHFLGVVQTGTDAQPQWTLYRFSADGSQTEIATYNAPIAAFFENAYVVDGQNGSMWFTYSNNPISTVPWNSAQKCQATGDALISTSHVIAPDKKQAFVMINCEKSNLFYLENEDGSKIEPLNGSIDASLGLLPQWSLDGKYVSIITFNYKDPFADTTVYLFDIEKMLKDPSTQPIQTTLNMTVSGKLVFGFPPGDNDKPQEQSTPKPLTFSLTTQQAKLLANFTVLEPSYLPVGYNLEGMDYDPYTQKIAMKYVSQQSEGILFVYQRRGDFMHDPVVQAYVTPVSIGDIEAEYVQGAWIYDTPETTIPRWDPSATFYSLTWQKGEVVFSIEFIGGETVTPPSLADFIAIAESLK